MYSQAVQAHLLIQLLHLVSHGMFTRREWGKPAAAQLHVNFQELSGFLKKGPHGRTANFEHFWKIPFFLFKLAQVTTFGTPSFLLAKKVILKAHPSTVISSALFSSTLDQYRSTLDLQNWWCIFQYLIFQYLSSVL